MLMADRRKLTDNEKKFVKHVFGATIHRDNVEVIRSRPLSGGFTPLGSVYMGNDDYQADYIGPNMYQPPGTPLDTAGNKTFEHAHLFLHELGHVWQHYVGMSMLHARLKATRAARRMVKAANLPKVVGGLKMQPTYMFNATYNYDPTTGDDLADYNMEQQCDIIADHFALVMWGKKVAPNGWGYAIATRAQLADILENFLEDPGYVKRDRPLWRARAKVRRENRD
jgi:hypothetical protein